MKRIRLPIILTALFCFAFSLSAGAAAQIEEWLIENDRSRVEFTADAFFENVDGRFKTFSGTLQVNREELLSSRVRVEIDPASIDTGSSRRDDHLRSDDFFAVAKYPAIVFESTQFERIEGDRYKVTGNLTMHGVTREITFPVVITEREGSIVANAELEVSRRAFGIDFRSFFNPIKDQVEVRFAVEAKP